MKAAFFLSRLARSPRAIALSIFVSLLAACQPAPRQSAPEAAAPVAAAQTVQVATSDNDPRSYRYVELPNRLRVLLISAPNTDKAAAALDVNVGSRQDPADRQGLAHFLEHMLFLGTDRFPVAGEYQDFITAHGGEHNAFTAFEDTNYFFDIDSRYLEPALDRFSRFFVAPLFSAEYVDREKHAVFSEYKAGIRDDQRRGLDVFREVVNPGHPLAKFSVGNLDTLADRPSAPVRDDLLKFYAEHYSANLMTLVVVGRESLDDLEKMVAARFGDIPDRQRTVAPIDAPLFAERSLPKRVAIKPVRDEYGVSYTWPIPDQRADYEGKSIDYIANILGHEGKGSLLSWLKQRGWAQGLSAGQGMNWRGGATFSVNIALTEAGGAHVDEITRALYQAIDRIRNGGVQARLYDEQKTIAQQRFRFRDLPPPIDEARDLAGNLQEYPAVDVIRGDYLMNRFEPTRIGTLAALLTPQRMLMTVTSPDAQTDRSSAFYAAPYRVGAPTSAELARWTHPAPNADILLPEPNIFVAHDLSLKTPPAATDAQPAPPKPTLLRDERGLHLWFLQDSVYRLPKAAITIEIHSPVAGDSPRHAVASELLVRVLRENLNEFSYPAALAGLSYDIGRTPRGIAVRVQGFNEKTPVLLERVLDALRQPQVDAKTLARVAAEYRRELGDNNKRAPYQLVANDIGNVLLRDRWPDDTLRRHTKSLDAAQIRRHAEKLLAAIDVDALVYGNVDAGDARAVGQLIERELLSGARVAPVPQVAVTQLPLADLRRKLPAPHDDAALLLYRQAADNAKSSRAALGVSAQMLAADFYGKLRTEQQLGYVVSSSVKPIREVPGIVFLAQSPVAGPHALAAAFRDFFRQWALRTPDELRPLFERHKAALLQMLAEEPKNFGEANGRLWEDLSTGYREFDSRAQIMAAVDALTFEQWLPLFRRDVVSPEGHNLWLSVDGRFKADKLEQGRDLGDLARFKKTQSYYFFP